MIILKFLTCGFIILEIVEEYYSALGGLLVGQTRAAKATMWCCFKMQFENMRYLWDEEDHDAPV